MSSAEAQLLDSFAEWLSHLGTDVANLAEALDQEASRPPPSTTNPGRVDVGGPALEAIAGALNYLFKSIDLIQDGIEDLGYLDDCFVLRVSAATAIAGVSVRTGVLERLGADAELVRDFLGDEDYERLRRYVEGTRELKVRGRTPSEIVTHEDVRNSFLSEIFAWSRAYEAPHLTRDPSTLPRLRSFLAAKLPS